jgi:hypothetical protein
VKKIIITEINHKSQTVNLNLEIVTYPFNKNLCI